MASFGCRFVVAIRILATVPKLVMQQSNTSKMSGGLMDSVLGLRPKSLGLNFLDSGEIWSFASPSPVSDCGVKKRTPLFYGVHACKQKVL